jgi:sugar O-acyltransferase (sialic acid O-acetyltransferase NeuD family)
MENPVLIFGARHVGRIAKEIFDLNGVVVYGFLDDDAKMHKTELDEVVVLGSTDDDGFLKLIGRKCEAFVAVDDGRVKKRLVAMLNEVRKVQPVNAVHPGAAISARAEVGHGNLIESGVKIAPGAVVGNHNLLHTNAYVGVAAQIGNYVQVGPGAYINAAAVIHDEAFVGSGVTIVGGVTIGRGARIGAGSVVVGPVKEGETVFGNPAQPVKS